MYFEEDLWVEEVEQETEQKTYTVGCWGLDGDC